MHPMARVIWRAGTVFMAVGSYPQAVQAAKTVVEARG